MDYIVKTPEFEGPFDLLLHLISRQKVDLWQVSLSRITEDYLAEIRRMEALNLGVATEFLVVAATLIELKAARLLPGADAETEELLELLEERDLLFARLLQYQAYKRVAGLLAGRFADARRLHGRTVGPDEQLELAVPNLLARVTPEDLARLAAKAFTPTAVPLQGGHIAPPPALSLSETVTELLAHFEEVGATTFFELVGSGSLPIEVVVRFLALLELYKRSVIDLEQPAAYADIAITWQGVPDPSVPLVMDLSSEGVPAPPSGEGDGQGATGQGTNSEDADENEEGNED